MSIKAGKSGKFGINEKQIPLLLEVGRTHINKLVLAHITNYL
jgi:hypothetical protein